MSEMTREDFETERSEWRASVIAAREARDRADEP